MQQTERPWNTRVFLFIWLSLALFYALWLIACWPGILGQDSLAILKEVDSQREFQSGKPPFWYLHVWLLYGPFQLVEIPILVQTLICVTICARILCWMWINQMRKSFAYCLIGIALGPSIVYYVSSLYSDGIYAIAVTGLTFEAWRCIRQKRIDGIGAWMLCLCIPYALFSRPNGLLNAIILIVLFISLSKPQRLLLGVLAIPWICIAIIAQISFPSRASIGTVFPMALYETVGFLEKRPMGIWERNEPRITEKSVQALTSTGRSLEHIQSYYDHYYWDPLIFFTNGPGLLSLSKESKKVVIREFYRHNLWHNFPAFAASRVNIFFYATLAMGGIPGPTNADNILPQTQARSEIRPYILPTSQPLLKWFDLTERHHGFFWSPWIGYIVLIATSFMAWRRRNVINLCVCTVYLAQFAAVFLFSIAGEYRYLLAFYTAPLALLPIITSMRPGTH
ncbi:hypothetical protein ALDI51_07490 [Alicycliphilus denitrificans]|nr:hypothetical protein ALDI51_07490 [Alicycliphilus denitrificans]